MHFQEFVRLFCVLCVSHRVNSHIDNTPQRAVFTTYTSTHNKRPQGLPLTFAKIKAHSSYTELRLLLTERCPPIWRCKHTFVDLFRFISCHSRFIAGFQRSFMITQVLILVVMFCVDCACVVVIGQLSGGASSDGERAPGCAEGDWRRAARPARWSIYVAE